jgi:deazaflavin-dependent oxidoreductase (nitroreductase family)
MTTDRYVVPTRIDHLTNRLVGWLARRGIGAAGARVLAVRGRTSGDWRTTVVNPLTLGDERYLVAPRGRTQWVRNLEAAGGGELRLGKRAEAFRATPVPDDEKGPVLRAYLDAWGWEVGRFFDGLGKDSDDAAVAAVAPDFPVFRITGA